MTKTNFVFCFLWLLIGLFVSYVTILLNLSFNLFSWKLKVDTFILFLLVLAITLLLLTKILANKTKGTIETWFAFIIGVTLVIIGFDSLWNFYHETISSELFGRNNYSPHWFRLVSFLFFCMPFLNWYFYTFKNYKSTPLK